MRKRLVLRLQRETRGSPKEKTSVTGHQMSGGTFGNQGPHSVPYSYSLRFDVPSAYGAEWGNSVCVCGLPDEAHMVCGIRWQGEGRGIVPPERLSGWPVWAKRRATDGWAGEGGLLLRFPQPGHPAHLGPGWVQPQYCSLVSGILFLEKVWSLGSRPCGRSRQESWRETVAFTRALYGGPRP